MFFLEFLLFGAYDTEAIQYVAAKKIISAGNRSPETGYFFLATFYITSVSNEPMIDDRVLVSNILEGNMQAFKLLVKQHERLVAHMIGRVVKNKEETEELCQDVFLKVYEKLSEFSFKSKLSTWIATIAYRHAINQIRKNKILQSGIPEENSFTAYFVEEENPESVLIESDLEGFVLKLVDQLPPQYKIVLTLFHLEDMSYSEIGEVTGMPEGTVKNYLFRARNLLKEKVKHHLGKEEIL